MNKRPKTEATPDDFSDLAARIRMIADQYDAVADSMRQRGIETLHVLGMDTLNEVTLLRMNGPLSSAHRALATMKNSGKQVYKVAEDPQKLRVEREANAANRKAASRAKKKD